MYRKFSVLLVLLSFFLLSSCAGPKEESESLAYPRKPGDTSSRKAGAAMLLYEQAEKDMDVNDNVEVIPPDAKASSEKKE